MFVVFIKRANRSSTALESKPCVEAGGAQDEKSLLLYFFLPQGKTKQLGADSLILHTWCYRKWSEMQSAHFFFVKSIGVCNVCYSLVAMNTYPFVQEFFIFMKVLKQSDFILTLREGLSQQS